MLRTASSRGPSSSQSAGSATGTCHVRTRSDNIKVRAKVATTFTNHGMQVPQLLFLKVSNEIQLETDLTFVRQ